MSGMRVVVVGATGNIGTSVLHALRRDPQVGEIVALSRREPDWPGSTGSAGDAGSAREVRWQDGIRWKRADILDADLTEHFLAADAVIHLAWIFQPTHDPVTTWRNNVLGSIRVCEAATAAHVPHLVYASSVAAYSPGPRNRAVDENWPTHGWPGAAYSREKAYVERFLEAFELSNPQIAVTRMRTAFCFKRESASQQRRLFLGPLLPNSLVRPDLLPAVPDLPGLLFQAVHSDDVGEAYRLVTRTAAPGPFNIAADPPIDAAVLAELFGARRKIPLPRGPVRAALSVAWNLHLVPASPDLFDAMLHLPEMDTGRARSTLDWTPRHSATAAIAEFVHGLRASAGDTTPPLAPKVPGGRLHEVRTGVGHSQ
ncbi:NAD-dependent epimerase/dehydratase family protein [Parasphingorhabdus pacifica]